VILESRQAATVKRVAFNKVKLGHRQLLIQAKQTLSGTLHHVLLVLENLGDSALRENDMDGPDIGVPSLDDDDVE
jgi:hypothetical protein